MQLVAARRPPTSIPAASIADRSPLWLAPQHDDFDRLSV